MSRSLASFTLLLAACGTTADQPDPQPDAGVDSPPARYVISRGVVGRETLVAVDGANETVLSDGERGEFCGGKIFCNLPPDDSVNRFAFVRYAGGDRVVYLDLDPIDWARTRVVSAELSGARRDLAAEVRWPATTPDWPLSFVVAATEHAGAFWFSLPIEGGMGLFRTDGTAALAQVATSLTPPGLTYMESAIAASDLGAVWSVRWRRGVASEDPYEYRTIVLGADGAVRLRVPEDLAGAVDGGDLGHLAASSAVIHWERDTGELSLELVDLATGTRTPIAGDYMHQSLAGRDGVVLVGTRGGTLTRVIDATTGAQLDELDGQPFAIDGGRVFYRDPASELRERDWTTHADRLIAPAGSASLNAMAGVVAPDRSAVAVASGAPLLDLAENVGISLVDLSTLAATEIEPPATSERFTRRMAFAAGGRWLLYLHPVGETLQLAGYDRLTGARAVLTAGTEHVRQVVLP